MVFGEVSILMEFVQMAMSDLESHVTDLVIYISPYQT